MGIALYKPGDTHEIRGVKCTMEVFEIWQLDSCLKDGWKKNPQDTLEVENATATKEEKKQTKKVKQSKKNQTDKEEKNVKPAFRPIEDK